MVSQNYLSAMVLGFASSFGIDVADDLHHLGELIPSLAQLDTRGRFVSHIQDELGADYFCSRIEYWNARRYLQAYRVIARISSGKRTKLAYWPKTASYQKINIHQGQGYFILGDPDNTEMGSTFNSAIYTVNAEVTPTVFLPPGRFYTLQAASWSSKPFVVSALCQMQYDGKWGSSEIQFEPGNDTINTIDGIIDVPDDFMSGNFM